MYRRVDKSNHLEKNFSELLILLMFVYRFIIVFFLSLTEKIRKYVVYKVF